jgi:hypothetical protein
VLALNTRASILAGFIACKENYASGFFCVSLKHSLTGLTRNMARRKAEIFIPTSPWALTPSFLDFTASPFVCQGLSSVLCRLMEKRELLHALQTEIHRHTFHFVENPPAMAQGGKGVVVPGCPAFRKRINTMAQFLDHL